MRGGRVGFIENRARLAQHHHARRMTVLRELWYCHVAVLSFHASSPSNPPRFPCAYPFLSDFRGQFWRSSGTQTGSCGISSESSRRPLSNDIKFARIGVRTRELWLPEVGVSELFSCTLPAKIPIKRGMLSANREFHDVAGVIIFPTHPGSRINLLRAGKTLRAKAAVREKKCVLLPARFFSNLVPVPDSRESELGLVRYGPASRVHRGVFGPFEGSFPIRIPADPDKFLAIREFHVVHGCVLFPMCPGSQINLLRVRKTLCASAATSVGKFRKFQHSLISSACFHARGRRSSRCRIPTILVSPESLRYLLFNGTGLAQRALVGSDRLGSGCLVLRADTRENPGGLRSTISFRLYVLQFGLDDHPSLKPGMNRGRIGLGDHPGLETKFVIRVSKRRRIGDESAWVTTQVSSRNGLETKFVIRVRIGLGDHPGLETETNRGRIGLGDHPGLETKFVIRVRIGLGDHPGLETETNRGRIGLGDHPGLETKFVIRVRIGLGDHPGLETETNRGRIGLGDHPGLETERIGLGDHPGLETKFVIRVRIGLGDHPGLETETNRGRIGLGDHPGLETETNRGRIGLGDHPGLETKFVIRVRIGLGDHPGLETETNRGRIGLGDHPGLETKFVIRVRIGLGDHPGLETKFVIRVRIGLGDHPGLETETNRGRIGLGDHPGLETKFVIRVRIGLGDHPGLETETNRGRIGLGDHPGLETKFVIRVRIGLGDHPGLETETNRGRIGLGDHPVGVGAIAGPIRLAKGKAVAYAPESSPDTDDEYDAMEDVRTRVDASLARDLQAEFDAEAAGSAPSAARAPPRPGVVIGRSAGPSETTRPSPQPSVTTGSSDAPPAAPRRAHTRYPPHGGIRPRYPVAVEISDTPLLTNLLAHPSSLVRRCQEPPYSAGRGGWSEFSRLLAVSRPEYREFLIGLGFGPFLSIPYVSVYHPAVWCFIERFFHHTGTFHLSTCEMAVLPVDWSAILGIRFGGRAPPSEPIDGFEAREILGLADHDATEGTRRPSVRIRYLADVLRRDREEPPTELRYRQWAAYFIFSCFLGNDRSIVPTPIVGMFRDIDTLREYDWGALTYGFYIRGLRRYSRRESISFLGFWQFTVFWAFEHFPTFAPSRLPLASDPDFPLARRWDTSRIERMTTCTLLELRMTVDCLRDADIIFQPYSAALSQRPEVFRAVALSRLRLWIRTTRSWELLLAPSDPYIAGVSAYPSLVREGVPYQEWFEQVSLGSLMSLHEVEGGRVMGGVAMDSHHIRSSGQIERLEGEGEMQTEATRREGEMVQMQRDLAQSQRDLGSRDAEVARLAAAVRRLEDQLHGMGITPVTGADLSGPGQPSSSPPRDPVSRDWFFDDPSPP
uniref:Aminotransferase-like plant mobile domain-containing protein n=1 Tax=Fagus sylvatica TaxID=28930 RepID=A0A2N9FKJ5_FAGSY